MSICTFCMDECKNVRVLSPCKHEFCYECIQQWTATQLKESATRVHSTGPEVRCSNCRTSYVSYLQCNNLGQEEEFIDFTPYYKERIKFHHAQRKLWLSIARALPALLHACASSSSSAALRRITSVFVQRLHTYTSTLTPPQLRSFQQLARHRRMPGSDPTITSSSSHRNIQQQLPISILSSPYYLRSSKYRIINNHLTDTHSS